MKASGSNAPRRTPGATGSYAAVVRGESNPNTQPPPAPAATPPSPQTSILGSLNNSTASPARNSFDETREDLLSPLRSSPSIPPPTDFLQQAMSPSSMLPKPRAHSESYINTQKHFSPYSHAPFGYDPYFRPPQESVPEGNEQEFNSGLRFGGGGTNNEFWTPSGEVYRPPDLDRSASLGGFGWFPSSLSRSEGPTSEIASLNLGSSALSDGSSPDRQFISPNQSHTNNTNVPFSGLSSNSAAHVSVPSASSWASFVDPPNSSRHRSGSIGDSVGVSVLGNASSEADDQFSLQELRPQSLEFRPMSWMPSNSER